MVETQKEFGFKLYNQEWKLKLVKNDEINKIIKDEGLEIINPGGVVHYRNGIIYVNEDYVKGSQLRTLLHEMVHVFLMPMDGSEMYQNTGGVDLETTCTLVANCLIELCDQRVFTFNYKGMSE